MRYATGGWRWMAPTSRVRAGELLVILGQQRLRQIDVAEMHRRPAAPDRRTRAGRPDATSPCCPVAPCAEARMAMAMVFQQARLVGRRSVLANVLCGTLGRHRTLASAVGVLPRAERAPRHGMSGGSRPRRLRRTARRHAVRRPGAARLDRARAGAAPRRAAGRRAGGQPRPRSLRGGDAAAAADFAPTTGWR